jgi:uncharacterized tellurite resistance protein B-like protein
MGLFDALTGGREREKTTLTANEAIPGILVAVANADGDMADEEIGALVGVTRRMRMLESLSDEQHDAMINKLFSFLKKQGASALLQAGVASCPRELRDTAFLLATDMVLSDGVVEQKEKEFLMQLKKALGIADDVAQKIVDVMKIKNKA